MDRHRTNQIFRTLGTILAFALLIFLLSKQGWADIWDDVRALSPFRIALTVGLMLVSRAAVAARWHTLLRYGGVSIRLRDSFRITFAGLFASNFLPTTIGGDVIRLAMALRSGYDSVIATASLAVDRLVGMTGMASSAVFGIRPVIVLARPAEATAFLSGLPARIKDIFSRVLDTTRLWVKSPRGLLIAFGWTWVHQLCTFAIVWVLLDGLNDRMPFWLIAGLWSFTYFVTLLPVSINGLGLQELSMTAIFSTLGGTSVGSAATAAFLVRTLQMIASLPGAAFISDILAYDSPGGKRDADAD